MAKEHERIKKPAKGRRYYRYESTVAFFDLVGFSKRSTSAQMAGKFVEIQQMVAETFWDDFDWGETSKENTLILIPTGDGYAICFPRSVEDSEVLAYVRDLSKKFMEERKVKVRFGISRGVNFVVEDVNEMPNLVGWGITMAQRVMSIGGAGHILCTGDFAQALEKDVEELHKLPKKIKIKHGDTLTVYNYYSKVEKFGNPKVPKE